MSNRYIKHLALYGTMTGNFPRLFICKQFDVERTFLFTYVLASGNTKFYVIALKELMCSLNSVDGVQDYHRQEYGDDLF